MPNDASRGPRRERAGIPAGRRQPASPPPCAPAFEFPPYTRREAAADGVVHLVGVPAALRCIAWMLSTLLANRSTRQFVAASLYGVGLVGMLSASAAYNLTSPGRAKAVLRRLDHAMIFVMIAAGFFRHCDYRRPT